MKKPVLESKIPAGGHSTPRPKREKSAEMVPQRPYIHKENILNPETGKVDTYRFHMALCLADNDGVDWPNWPLDEEQFGKGDEAGKRLAPVYHMAHIMIIPGMPRSPGMKVFHGSLDVPAAEVNSTDRFVFTVWENERGGDNKKGVTITQADDAPDYPH